MKSQKRFPTCTEANLILREMQLFRENY